MQSCRLQRCPAGARISVVVAFGQILPPAVLNERPWAAGTASGSLLPTGAEAAPISGACWEGTPKNRLRCRHAMEDGLKAPAVLRISG